MEIQLEHTSVLSRNRASLTRFTVNQGGTGSSKTVSLCQLFIIEMLQGTGVLSIVRKTMPSLRATAMRDFFLCLHEMGLYDEKSHNRGENIYRMGRSEVEFFGLDEPQKVRGRKRRWLWLNEANEFAYEDYTQLNLRTTDRVFMDYNPSDEQHWIYDKIIPREDCTFIKSTYRDNPFLAPAIVAEVERLREEDPEYWKIYGEGEVGRRGNVIYTNWDEVDEFPLDAEDVFYGLDFGFNAPTALVRLALMNERDLYVDELIYERGLTNQRLMQMMDPIITTQGEIVADSEDPQRIEEISEYVREDGSGFNVVPAIKGRDSVSKGIDTLKSMRIHITKRSANMKREIRGYKWKQDRNMVVLDEPLKHNDHLMDGMRYPVHLRQLHPEPSVGWL